MSNLLRKTNRMWSKLKSRFGKKKITEIIIEVIMKKQRIFGVAVTLKILV